MRNTKRRNDEAAKRMEEQKRLAAEQAAARLRARDVTEQLSARDAERARRATTGQASARRTWQTIGIAVVVLVVILVAAYAVGRFGFYIADWRLRIESSVGAVGCQPRGYWFSNMTLMAFSLPFCVATRMAAR